MKTAAMSRRLLEVERALQGIGWGQTVRVFAGLQLYTPYLGEVDEEIARMLAASPIAGVEFCFFDDDAWRAFNIAGPLEAAELDRLIGVIQAALVANRIGAQL